jgi:thymidylate kinase
MMIYLPVFRTNLMRREETHFSNNSSRAELPNALLPRHRSSLLEALITSVFREWSRSGVVFLILRNYEGLPVSTDNDVDVLVAPEQIRLAERVMADAAASCGFRIHNRVEFATLSYFLYHPNSLQQLQIDLFSNLSWHSFEMISTAEVLRDRQTRGLFSIPHPVHEAVINLVTRLIYQGNVKENYRTIIHEGIKRYPERARQILEQTFGQRLGADLVRLSLAQEWPAIERLEKELRKKLVARCLLRRPVATAGHLVRDLLRFGRRLFQPGGLVVVVLGPDGSGKSTVSEQVMDQLRNTFNPGKLLHVHWKPVVFFKNRRKPSGVPTIDPHSKPQRQPAGSFLYLLLHWAEFFIGSNFLFRKTTFKNGLVLVDRYHYDFLVDQRRYRLKLPNSLVRLIFRTIPDPDLVFLFDAPPEVLQARKKEVSFEETARQAQVYRAVVGRLRPAHILDATQPVQEVARQMTGRILDYMARRTARRLNLEYKPVFKQHSRNESPA